MQDFWKKHDILVRTTLALQETCKNHITVARILEETKGPCKNHSFRDTKMCSLQIFKSLPGCGNEAFKMLVWQVVLKKENLNH